MNSKLSTLLVKMLKKEKVYIEQQILNKSKPDNLDKFILACLRKGEKLRYNSPKLESMAYYKMIEMLTELLIKNVPSTTHRMALQIQLHYEKMLFNEAFNLLKKNKKNAEEYDNYALLLELLEWEEKIINAISPQNPQELRRIIQERNHVIKCIQNINEFHNLSNELMILLKTGSIRNDSDMKKLKEITNSALLENENKAICLTAKMYYYVIKSGLQWMQNDFEPSIVNMTKLLSHFENNAKVFSSNTLSYIISYQNFLMLAIHQKKHGFVEDRLIYLRNDVSKKIPELFFYTQNNLEITIAINFLQNTLSSKNYENGLKQAKEIEKKLLKLPVANLEPQLILAFYNLAYLYFVTEKHSEALNILNYINQNFKIDIRTHLHTFASVMQVIIHYERENYTLMNQIIRSTKGRLLKNVGLKVIENAILSAFYTKKAFPEKNDFIATFTELRKKIIELENDKENIKYLMSFNIKAWLTSKIDNIELKDLL
jgi:predicted O-linked N-acetylglucosamine transferase (SPINDLY family)